MNILYEIIILNEYLINVLFNGKVDLSNCIISFSHRWAKYNRERQTGGFCWGVE